MRCGLPRCFWTAAPLKMRVLLKERTACPSHVDVSQEFKDELCREVISTSKPIKKLAEGGVSKVKTYESRLTLDFDRTTFQRFAVRGHPHFPLLDVALFLKLLSVTSAAGQHSQSK